MDIVDLHMIINSTAFRQRIRCFLSISALTEGIAADLKRLIGDSDDIVSYNLLYLCLLLLSRGLSGE